MLIDDDVAAPPGWLEALLAGVAADPDREVFGGPIRARLEGGGPRACGREPAPITTLDLGPADRDVELVWSANMAIRRARWSGWDGLTRRSTAGARRRTGSGATAPRAGASATWPRPGWSTAARPATPVCSARPRRLRAGPQRAPL